MSEVTFAKGFLATLDKRPIKLPADHVSDPRKYPGESPFILPKQTHPFPRKSAQLSTAQTPDRTITATLKPTRAGETVEISGVSLDSTIHDLKNEYAQKTSQPLDKIKLLYNKKPAADLKTLKDLGIDNDAEFTIMIMGGGTSTPSASTPAVEKSQDVASTPAADKMEVDPAAPAPVPAPASEKAQAEAEEASNTTSTTKSILESEEFWTDLKGYLAQRLRDQQEAERLALVFRNAHKNQ